MSFSSKINTLVFWFCSFVFFYRVLFFFFSHVDERAVVTLQMSYGMHFSSDKLASIGGAVGWLWNCSFPAA